MRRAAPWLAAAGVLAGSGALLVARAGSPAAVRGLAVRAPTAAYDSRLELSFDSLPWSVVWTAGQLVGLCLLAAALLLVAGLVGWWLGGRAPGRDVRAARGALLLGGVGAVLVLAGIAVTLSNPSGSVVVYSGSYQPLCPGPAGCASPPWHATVGAGQLVGLAVAVGGAAVLAGVSGRLLGAERRVDQR